MNRTLVCLSIVAAALLLGASRAESPDQGGADKLGWKLTLQSWTVHQTVAQSLEIAQKLGLRYIEIYPNQPLSPDDKTGFGPGMSDTQVQTVLAKAKECGVKIIDCGVIGIPNKEEDARKLFDWAKKVGITTIVSEPDPSALPMIDKVAGDYGMQVAIHDHPKPSRYWDPAFVYDHIKDLKHVGFCADVGHWKRSGLEPVEVLEKYGDRVLSLHFKDLVPTENGKGWHDVPWGNGQSQAAGMLRVLKVKGFKGPIALEFEYKWDLPTLQKCVDFFNDEANKLAAK
jgi:sugar phosphate isomerase/epimerase